MKKFLIYGDSVSCEFKHDPSITWTRLLQKTFIDNDIEIEIYNHSRPGETTELGKNRLPFVLKDHYDYAFVELGGNDFLNKRPCKEIYNNLTEICNELKNKGIKVLLQEVLVGISDHTPEEQRFNRIYHNIAKELGVFLVRLPPILTDEDIEIARGMFDDDGIHFNYRSQPMICDWVYSSIKDQL